MFMPQAVTPSDLRASTKPPPCTDSISSMPITVTFAISSFLERGSLLLNLPMGRRVTTIVLAGLTFVTASAAAGQPRVLVVPPFPLERYAGQGAVGSLVTGKVRSSLLGGVPEGENLVRLGEGTGPTVYVSLPPPGRSAND